MNLAKNICPEIDDGATAEDRVGKINQITGFFSLSRPVHSGYVGELTGDPIFARAHTATTCQASLDCGT